MVAGILLQWSRRIQKQKSGGAEHRHFLLTDLRNSYFFLPRRRRRTTTSTTTTTTTMMIIKVVGLGPPACVAAAAAGFTGGTLVLSVPSVRPLRTACISVSTSAGTLLARA